MIPDAPNYFGYFTARLLCLGNFTAKFILINPNRDERERQMATQTIITGTVQFNGVTLELGKPYWVNGRKGTPFMAWVRDGVTPDGFQTQPSTIVRFKWANTYMPSDFDDKRGCKVVIREFTELVAA